MPAQTEVGSEISTALECLKRAYQTPDAATVFVKAYRECVGGPAENALCDFRLYRDGQTAGIPPYIERACRSIAFGRGPSSAL